MLDEGPKNEVLNGAVRLDAPQLGLETTDVEASQRDGLVLLDVAQEAPLLAPSTSRRATLALRSRSSSLSLATTQDPRGRHQGELSSTLLALAGHRPTMHSLVHATRFGPLECAWTQTFQQSL